MKKLFFLTIMFHIYLNMNAQTPNWDWAKGAGALGGEEGWSVTTDPAGNVIFTGSFSSPSIVFGNTTLNNVGNRDLVVVKYDSFGNLLWAQSVGGQGNEQGNGITTDNIGNIYLTGNFDSPSIAFGNTILTGVDSTDIFVVKYDAQGNVVWAKSAGGTAVDIGKSISTDNVGNVYVTGNFKSTTTSFGLINISNIDISSSSSDVYVAKYSSTGNELWVRQAGSYNLSNYFGNDYAYSITNDISGNILLSGMYAANDIVFGLDTLRSSSNGSHMFLVKYDANGNVLWAKGENFTPYSYSAANGVISDDFGNVYVTGDFSANYFIIGNDTLDNVGNSGNTDIFLIKFDASGNLIWIKGAGSAGPDISSAICTDAAGNVFITGHYVTTINFGQLTIGPAAATNIYVVKYDSSGNELWAQTASGSYYESSTGIASDPQGYLYITGYYSSSFIVGSNVLNYAGGGSDLFIAKLGNDAVSIDEKIDHNQINLYPNPSKGIFNFKDTKNIKQVEVYNLLGEQILAQGSQKQVNLSGFAKGIYYVRINGEVVVKLVKE